MTKQGTTLVILGGILLLLLPAGNASAAALIANFEGFRSTAYWDVNGWAIGYGSHWNYDQNRAVRQTDRIDRDTALRWLEKRIRENESFLYDRVDVPINTNQRDALLSLIYNIGTGAFAGSELLEKLNAGRPRTEVADQFLAWNKSGGGVNQHLVQRRAAERALFLR